MEQVVSMAMEIIHVYVAMAGRASTVKKVFKCFVL